MRRGIVEETSLSFAYVYLYELINGIGVAGPREGFRALESFWRSYREIAPEIDRFASVWLQDYVVYHGLPAELLEPYKALSFDRSLMALRAADEHARVIAAQHPTQAWHLALPARTHPRNKSFSAPSMHSRPTISRAAACTSNSPARCATWRAPSLSA